MTGNPKSTFARHVRAAKPRAKKYDVRDLVVSQSRSIERRTNLT